MKFIFALLTSSIIFISCNNHDKTTPTVPVNADSITKVNADTGKVIVSSPTGERENKILDMLKELPECKKSSAYLDSLTDHKHSLSYMIFSPKAGEKDYYVKAGYNGDERFETYYNFYVDSTTLKIKIADPIEGDNISLEEWRKRENKRNK